MKFENLGFFANVLQVISAAMKILKKSFYQREIRFRSSIWVNWSNSAVFFSFPSPRNSFKCKGFLRILKESLRILRGKTLALANMKKIHDKISNHLKDSVRNFKVVCRESRWIFGDPDESHPPPTWQESKGILIRIEEIKTQENLIHYGIKQVSNNPDSKRDSGNFRALSTHWDRTSSTRSNQRCWATWTGSSKVRSTRRCGTSTTSSRIRCRRSTPLSPSPGPKSGREIWILSACPISPDPWTMASFSGSTTAPSRALLRSTGVWQTQASEM